MDVRVLGPLQVLDDGRDITPKGRIQRALFLRLVLDANQVVSADRLVDDVIDPDQRLKNPTASLHVHVSRLRKSLAGDAVDTTTTDPIVSQAAGYCLRLAPDDLDALRFEALVAEAGVALDQARPEAAADTLRTALGLWRGPALVDFAFASYAQAEIARLDELRLTAVENLFEARLALGDAPELAAELRALVAEHPLRERLWGQLMRALYLDGRQTEALRAYQDLRRMLDDEVGLAPGRELQELEKALVRQDTDDHIRSRPSARRAEPNHELLAPPPLPRPLTRFVGRGAARAELASRLAETRLLTLKGMAGVGKTRLAVEVAADASSLMPEGVWLVELSSLADPALVVPAVASAMGVREEPGLPLVQALARTIGDRRLLVVLDNCEHLLQACAELVWLVLERCPNLRVLATSQEVLGIPGEAVWPVPPLSVPPTDIELSPEETAEHEAVQLFCDRAKLVQPEFVLSEANAVGVATICRRLDGLPLAIELAAAGVAQLSVDEIAQLLDDRFNLLTGGTRWVTTRHQSLLAAVEWSHALLSVPEQLVLRRVSVFAGGATLGAVEEVCAGGDVAVSAIFPVVSGLVAKSLVVADTSGHQARYRLLETIRHYAADRLLEAGEHTMVAEQHARWCVGLAERAEPELTGPAQYEWSDRLEADVDNFRAALAWAVAERRDTLALRLSAALTLFWSRRHWQEGREWLMRSLSIGASAPEPLRAKALWGVGETCLMNNDDRGAAAAAIESLALWRACGDLRGEARALFVLGQSGESHGGLTALQSLEQSTILARQAGDLSCLSEALSMLGWAQLHRGDHVLARPFLEEAVSVVRKAGDEVGLTPMLVGLGHAALFGGELARAEAVLTEALVLCRHQENLSGLSASGISATLILLAQVAMARGDYDSPCPLLDEALRRSRDTNSTAILGDCLYHLGRLALETGDVVKAEEFFARAQGIVNATGATGSQPALGLARVCLARDDPAGAKDLLAGALEHARHKGNAVGVTEVVVCLGELALVEGDLDEAMSCHRWTLTESARVGHLPGVAISLEAFARVFSRRHRPDQAVRLLGAAASLRAALDLGRAPVDLSRHEADIAVLHEHLGPSDFADIWAEGTRLSVTEAVDCALEGAGVE